MRGLLSYRREDAGSFAHWLGDRLKRDLRLENVFLDVRDVFGGDDWRRAIADRIDASDVVVALIGARWAGPRKDGTWRIFDDDDVVRWELDRALRVHPSHVVPTMLNGAQLPSALPHELTPLHRTQRLDLDPIDSPVCYCELLADVFMKTHHRRGRPIVVTDGSDQAEVYLDRLAYQLKNGELGMHGVVAVTAVTRGFAAVTLREASARWPDAIILRHPGADDEKLAAIARGVRRNTPKVVLAGAFGGTGGVTFEVGRSLIQPTPTPDPSPAANPLIAPKPSRSPSSAARPNSEIVDTPVRNHDAGSAGSTSTTGVATAGPKVGLGLAAKLATAGLLAVAAAMGATLVAHSPAVLSPSAATPIETTNEVASGTGTSQAIGVPPSKQPSIMPTECSTDSFWGTLYRRMDSPPGQTLDCLYFTENGQLGQITVFDGSQPLSENAQEVREKGRNVPFDGTEGAWVLENPRIANRLLLTAGGETLYAVYQGTSDGAIAAARRLLRFS